jgi:chromate transporter
MAAIIHLSTVFGLLSLLAVGGGTAVIPEMQTLLQQQFGIGREQFVHIYSIGQIAPGPNMLMVLIIGFQIAGYLGAAVVLASFFLPSSILCFYVGRIWTHFEKNPWRRTFQDALEPISIGLMASGVFAVGKVSINSPVTLIIACLSFVCILKTKINPVLVILVAGILGAVLTKY